ncbi:MAG: alpha/beta fold hydrolase, partial [Alphaproteobacteria bacterium]
MEREVAGKTAFAATGGRDFVASRPTMVFVHGAGMDHTVWALQTRYFANRGTNVLAVDLPGHGASAGPTLGSIGQMADWLDRFLNGLECGPSVLVGHSMGALVALDYSARTPNAARGLALLGACAPMAVGDALLGAARDDVPTAIAMMTAWSHSKSAKMGGNPTPGMWMAGATTRLLARAGEGVLFADLCACHGFAEGLDRAAQIVCPALVVTAANDLMTPQRQADALISALPDARHRTIDASGHMMMAEQPGEVLDFLADFVGARLGV